jgi:hypothetical protein
MMSLMWRIPTHDQSGIARYFYYRHEPIKNGPLTNYCVELHDGKSISSKGNTQVTWSGSLNKDVSLLLDFFPMFYQERRHFL